MAKSKVPAEIVLLDREERIAEFKRMVDQIVDERVAEAMGNSDAILQPWCQPKLISREIKRRQTVTEQQKFVFYFEEWGCMICGTKDCRHAANGMCNSCASRIRQRLRTIVLKHALPPDQIQPSFRDTLAMAREALGPSIAALAPARKAYVSEGSPTKPGPRLRTQTQAAKEAGIHRKTLEDWIAMGKVQHPKTKLSPTKWLWADEDIAKLREIARRTP